MASPVSKRLQLRVLDVLRTADTPLKTSEVAMLVNRSYEATRQALELVGAERVDTSFPTEWTISGSTTPAHIQRVPSKYEDTEYTIGAAVYDAPVAMWNANRQNLAKSIADLDISPDDDPKAIALRLGNGAGTMAHLAYKLAEYATRPDWYEALSKEG